MAQPRVLWDLGTAYDLFVSLAVLHRPSDYGVRGTWAAGVRARLPTADREALEQAQWLLPGALLHWVYSLPEPKDGATALWVLGHVQPADRLASLAFSPTVPTQVREILEDVAVRGAWAAADKAALQEAYVHMSGTHTCFARRKLTATLDAWASPGESGERYLQAFQTYYQVFYAEEERRIQPMLESALAQAQELARRSSLRDLLERLSQGLRFTELPDAAELVLVPSYWCTPIMIFDRVSVDREVWVFGAKPVDASLVPGEVVPDALLRTLKALSDPTRLRILRYLADEPLTPAELSRRLRLRAPTMTHHLRTLRVAGLVRLTVEQGVGREKEPYAARLEAVESACAALKAFLIDRDVEVADD